MNRYQMLRVMRLKPLPIAWRPVNRALKEGQLILFITIYFFSVSIF